jgi:cytoskeleton protein RodZ
VEHSVTEEATGPAQADAQTMTITSAEQLAAFREQRGMSKGEVAQRLKLHPRQLDAIERGDWAALPGRAFVRGCIRSYGRLLGVTVEPLLESVGGFAEAEDLKPTSTLARPMPRGGAFGFAGEGKGSKLPWALLGVIGVIAVALFFGRDGDVSKVTSWIGKTDAPSGTPSPASGASNSAQPGTPSGTLPPGTPLVPPPLIPAPGAPAAGAAPDPTAPASAAPLAPAAPPVAAPAAPPPPPIRLTVKQDAWVDVRQADGKSVFMGTVKPGQPAEVKGTAPFSLTIGNADKVALEFEGKPVDLKPSTGVPSNIAKVKLP